MINHELIPLLGTFSKGEIKQFELFLLSPYFNRNMTVISFFKILKRFYPLFTNELFTKESVYAELYPGKTYKDATVRNLCFLLFQQAQQFLKIEMAKQKDLELSIDLHYRLTFRYLINSAQKNIKKIESMLADMKVEQNLFYVKYLFEQSKFNYLEITVPFKKKRETYRKAQIVNQGIYYLFMHYSYQLASSYIMLFIYPKIFESKPIRFDKKLLLHLEYLKKVKRAYAGREYNFVSDILLLTLEMFINMEEDNLYLQLKKLVLNNIKKFSNYQAFYISTLMLTYCIMKGMRYGESRFILNEKFFCYKIIIDNKLYLSEYAVYMHDSLFIGAVNTGLKLKKYKWTRSFIEKYPEELQPANRENMLNYGLSKYYSEIGDWEKAIEYLNKISLDDFLFKLDVKVIHLRAFYSLEYLEESLSLIHTYKEFLRKDQVLQEHQKIEHRNFIDIMNQLVRYRLGKQRVDYEQIKSDLSKRHDILHRDWLSEQLRLLKNQPAAV